MANEYLKPQIPLKDLNSENYFYPLTTLDQIIIGNSRLSAYFSENDGKLIFNNIDEDSVGGSINLDGIIANRTLFVENDSLLSSENIFINNDSLAINTTSITSGYNFEVNGNSLFNGLISASSFLGALAEEQFNKTDIRTWCDTATNIHKSSYQGDMVLKRFFSQDEAATTYNLPCVDSHMMIFSIGGINWTRILALDMRSPTLFIGGKNNGNWQTWTQLITDNTIQTISGQKTFTSLLKINTNGNTVTIGSVNTSYCHFESSANIPFYFNRQIQVNGNYKIYNNNTTYNAGWIELSGGTPYIDFHFNNSTADYTSRIIENASGRLYVTNKLAIAYTNDSYSLATASFICNSWVRTVGATGWYSQTYGGGWYMSDNNWIRTYGSKSIYQNAGKIRTDGEMWSKYIRIVDNWIGVYENIDNTTKRFGYMQIDRSNNGLFRFVKENGGNFYFNTLVRIDGDLHVGNNSTVGHIICGTYKDTAHGEHQIQVNSGAGRWYLYSQASATGTRGIYGHNNAGTGVSVLYMNQDNYLRAGTRLYGAVWNDYAEFRKGQMDNLKPGQVVTEIGNGEMKLANKKLQKGCKILSDTYGFALGETKECKLPIAVAGRVLVYCDTIKEELEPGDCLCANYTGNTIKMTQEEIIKYPDRIIGIVSEIPNYNIWHSLDPDNPDVLKEDIKVDGRIWVYVR